LTFTASYRARGFAASVSPPIGVLTFTTHDLAHALFTTGRAPGDRAVHGTASVWEFIHRASLIPAYVRRAPSGTLTRSRLALELDRSEKVALSYALGQAMTAIFCAQRLSVRFLMHVDRYAARFAVRFGGRKRADLFGQDALGQWVVAEAKGRSNSMESALVSLLLAQKSAIISVAGSPPSLALGCVASFPRNTRTLRIDAFDPESGEIEPVRINVDTDRYILAYYEPFLAAIELGVSDEVTDRRVADGGAIEVARFESVGLRVGLLRDIAALVRQAREGETTGLAEAIGRVLAGPISTSLFADGTLVEADWDTAIETSDRDTDDFGDRLV
jgi:hypothetical protein